MPLAIYLALQVVWTSDTAPIQWQKHFICAAQSIGKSNCKKTNLQHICPKALCLMCLMYRTDLLHAVASIENFSRRRKFINGPGVLNDVRLFRAFIHRRARLCNYRKTSSVLATPAARQGCAVPDLKEESIGVARGLTTDQNRTWGGTQPTCFQWNLKSKKYNANTLDCSWNCSWCAGRHLAWQPPTKASAKCPKM